MSRIRNRLASGAAVCLEFAGQTLAASLPYKLGLLIAVVVGMAVAMIFEEWLENKQSRAESESTSEGKHE